VKILLELRRDRDREPGVPNVWNPLWLLSPWEREAIEPSERPASVDRDPLALPPRGE
jgi:hypothetical protein